LSQSSNCDHGCCDGRFPKGIAKGDWPLVAARVGAEIGAAYFFLTALINLPLANATAILQTLPLTVSLAGALFLGEMLGWRRMFAIVVGVRRCAAYRAARCGRV
jgi:S-adenosylmethionine uptake transporter